MLHVLEGSRLVWPFPFRHQSFNLPRTPCPRVFSFKKKKMQKLMTNFHAHVSMQMANNVVRNSAPHEAWQCTSLTRRAAHMVQSPSPTNAFFANMCFAACEQQRTTASGRDTAQGRVAKQFSPQSLQRVCNILFASFCHWQASGLDALLDHLARHAQRPGVQVESCHLFQSLHHGPVGVEQRL